MVLMEATLHRGEKGEKGGETNVFYNDNGPSRLAGTSLFDESIRSR